ncbi:uncharacterized protein LOC127251136 [Andrographis paniculata]|uniref:uncharacterized protein LOC127251136 n=1 Tax=Andrographis paniculata TaxID=175694 RepID=UPI0021E91075|nr:uncharacterized protein LOC127251136 [Andrographis paniculata]
MAARKNHHRYLTGGEGAAPTTAALHDGAEFDESEIWSTNDAVSGKPDPNKSKHLNRANFSPNRPVWKPARKTADRSPPVGPKSLPVNIPDWSKILGDEYRSNGAGDFFTDDEEDEEEDGNYRLPPHEYLARTRTASFSVHEGIGRTLKGVLLL